MLWRRDTSHRSILASQSLRPSPPGHHWSAREPAGNPKRRDDPGPTPCAVRVSAEFGLELFQLSRCASGSSIISCRGEYTFVRRPTEPWETIMLTAGVARTCLTPFWGVELTGWG